MSNFIVASIAVEPFVSANMQHFTQHGEQYHQHNQFTSYCDNLYLLLPTSFSYRCIPPGRQRLFQGVLEFVFTWARHLIFQAAVKNLDSVEQNLEFARDLQKHLVGLVTEVCCLHIRFTLRTRHCV